MSSKTQSDRANSVVSGKSLVGGRDWQSEGMAPIDGERGAQLKIGASMESEGESEIVV